MLYQAFILIFWFKMYPWITKYLVRGNVYLLVFQLIHEDGISRVSLFCNPNKLMGLSNDLHWFLTSHIKNQLGVMHLLMEVHYIAYEISLPRNQKASRSSNQFTGNARRRGTCWIIPWGCNQQDPYCGIIHRGIKNTSLTNQLKKKEIREGTYQPITIYWPYLDSDGSIRTIRKSGEENKDRQKKRQTLVEIWYL